jgi:hypothetical protein
MSGSDEEVTRFTLLPHHQQAELQRGWPLPAWRRRIVDRRG